MKKPSCLRGIDKGSMYILGDDQVRVECVEKIHGTWWLRYRIVAHDDIGWNIRATEFRRRARRAEEDRMKYQLGPVEPTIEMMEAGRKAGQDSVPYIFHDNDLRALYKAMRAAAPEIATKQVWAIIKPDGDVSADSDFTDEDQAWTLLHGRRSYPSDLEIERAKKEGYRAALVTVIIP